MGGRESVLGSEEAVWAVSWRDRAQYGVLLLTFKGKSVKLLIVVKSMFKRIRTWKDDQEGCVASGTRVRSERGRFSKEPDGFAGT